MLDAICRAEVGDDVLGDDPTVRRLEEEGAERLGAEAGLFVPSGTMGNEIAIRIHTRHGDQALCEADAHVYLFETGAAAALSGVQLCPVRGEAGRLDAEAVRAAIFPHGDPFPRPSLLCIENTHNASGGTVMPPSELASLVGLARDAGLRVHLDGARLFNAACALGLEPSELTRGADTTMVCLSKGLGAPVGSLLVGPRALMAEARRVRKQLGGGMRQAGLLAAAGLHALEHNVSRLQEDHEAAGVLADRLVGLAGVELDRATVQTNMVTFGVRASHGSAPSLIEAFAEAGIAMLAMGPQRIRAVLHKDAPLASLQAKLPVFDRLLG